MMPLVRTDDHAPTRAPVTCWRCGGSDRLVLADGELFVHRREDFCVTWKGER